MCRWVFIDKCVSAKLEISVFNDLNVDICISIDIARCYLLPFYWYVCRHKLTSCQINLHVVCYMYIHTSTRRWRYVDIFQSTYIDIWRSVNQVWSESIWIVKHRHRELNSYWNIWMYSSNYISLNMVCKRYL